MSPPPGPDPGATLSAPSCTQTGSVEASRCAEGPSDHRNQSWTRASPTGYSQALQAFGPGDEADHAVALGPGEVGAVGREGDCPGLAARLLVEGGGGHQELADELGLFWETSRLRQQEPAGSSQNLVNLLRRGAGGAGGLAPAQEPDWPHLDTPFIQKQEVEPARDQAVSLEQIIPIMHPSGFIGLKATD